MIEYLTPEEYAARFRKGLSTVYRWCNEGKLPTLPRPPGTRGWTIIVTPAMRGETSNVLPFAKPQRKLSPIHNGNAA